MKGEKAHLKVLRKSFQEESYLLEKIVELLDLQDKWALKQSEQYDLKMKEMRLEEVYLVKEQSKLENANSEKVKKLNAKISRLGKEAGAIKLKMKS